ncbi:MAG: NAD-dependent epimerase/dehydratase family protein [Bacteroidetes bacterium]|nr:MAG: NAD-dependent epimerase/dehydratase family protein [Bacteroidota bacterium]MBL1145598.1 SDR family oxidoreductase [Bacteroidota bacterium]NOG58394.1 SDR family oxidoreductase [Bacteroidota bacterium]
MYKTNFHQTDISNFTFLVTGGAGFIGSNIVEYLLTFGAKKVIVLDNLETGNIENVELFQSHPNYTFIKGDISDYETCIEATKGVDFISHQAALGSVPRSLKNPVATNRANVDGFLNVLTAARENGVKRMVFASSSSVYGDSPVLPKVEHEIGNPLSPYAVSKVTNELYARVSYLNYGQKVMGLRYFNVFGPRQSPKGAYAAVIPLFIDALSKNESPFINGDGEQTRDFTFVENAVQANIRALFTKDEKAFGEVFNVALGDRFTLKDLFNTIKEITKSNSVAIHREERAGDIRDSLANISKSEKLLGYKPQIKFKEGLEKTVKWFLSDDNKFKI